MTAAKVRYLVNGQLASGPDRVVKVHSSQMPSEVMRVIGNRTLELQKQDPDASVITVEIGDLLLPRQTFTPEQAQARHDSYVAMAGWALDQATAIRREYDLPLTDDEHELWSKETHA